MLDAFELLVIVLLNGVIDCVLVAWLAGRRSKQALVRWLESDESEEFIKHILEISWQWMTETGKIVELWNWLMASPMETNKTIKTLNEDGIEVSSKETVTPFIVLCRGLGQYVKMSLLGTTGGNKARDAEFMKVVANDLQDPNNPLAGIMRSALPGALLRAQKTGDYQPIIQLLLGQFVQDYLKKRQPPSGGAASAPNMGDLGF